MSNVGRYCVVRTYSAGVVCGVVLEERDRITLVGEARIIHRWRGAKTVIEIANEGVGEGSNLSAPSAEPVRLTETIMTIPCTKKAEEVLRQWPT